MNIATHLTEKNYRSLFKATVVLKGLIALGEIALGTLFIFVSYDTMRRTGLALFGGELAETQPDFIWKYVIQGFHGITSTPQSVWVFIFLSHGIVKLGFIIPLLRERLWAYPWSAGVFALFIVYQIWQMTTAFSAGLLLVTILDAIVVGLVLHEYRYRRRRHFRDLAAREAK